MKKMLPWVQKEWDNLTPEEQSTIKSESVRILDHITKPLAVKVAISSITKLYDAFPFLMQDTYPAYDNIRNADINTVCKSDMECLQGYFTQFVNVPVKIDNAAKPLVKKLESKCEVGSKMLAHNDAYGDIIVEVTSITDTSYITRYIKNHKLIIKFWRIPKGSPRIIQYNVE